MQVCGTFLLWESSDPHKVSSIPFRTCHARDTMCDGDSRPAACCHAISPLITRHGMQAAVLRACRMQMKGAATIDVSTISLDKPENVPPAQHIYCASQVPWLQLADGLPCREGDHNGS